MNLRNELEKRVSQALSAAGAPAGSPAMVAPAANPKFGDYQANGVMAAAKKLKANPRELAAKVVAQLQPGGAAELSDLAEKVEVAGPGFINIKLKKDWLQQQLAAAGDDEHLGVDRPSEDKRQNIVVDYSAPNLAKEMHVGHLRSTIIGDALARVLEFAGHSVIRQNHVGDWGTQFGMLIAYMERTSADASASIADLEDFYRQAKRLFDSDPAFADTARQYVVRLQGGDPEVRHKWEMFADKSLAHADEIYSKLNVGLRREHIRGESSYNDMLPGVVEDLRKAGLLTESQGAQCVFLPDFTGKDGEPLPLIVQKSDEGYLYATTDLAAIRYRVSTLHANRVLYSTDAGQSLHFRMVFAVARAAGFAPPEVSLEHVAFGVMLAEGGGKFRTRTGGTIKLMALLDEAVQRAYALVNEKNADDVAKDRAEPLSEGQKRDIANAVGIGAMKYADLSQNRTSDYVFSFDKMLSLDGNTAPYMQYAYARIQSIFRKGGDQGSVPGDHRLEFAIRNSQFAIQDPPERALALRLVQFPETIAAVAADCMPNVLCAYLYDLAGAFTTFYENCPVLKSQEPTRSNRLALCELTARTIKTGLGLLGIQTIEQM